MAVPAHEALAVDVLVGVVRVTVARSDLTLPEPGRVGSKVALASFFSDGTACFFAREKTSTGTAPLRGAVDDEEEEEEEEERRRGRKAPGAAGSGPSARGSRRGRGACICSGGAQ